MQKTSSSTQQPQGKKPTYTLLRSKPTLQAKVMRFSGIIKIPAR